MSHQTSEWFESVRLECGTHVPNGAAACTMEAVSQLGGEPWSDHPATAGPVLGAYFRAWNDGLGHEDRDRILRPFLPQLVGAAGTWDVEERRGYMALDWLVRVHAAAWLDLVPELR